MAIKNININRIRSILFIPVMAFAPTLVADQEIITDDGREVLLKDDGSWEFRSTDRYANTNDDRRVRLKNNNTWEYVGNAPLTSREQVRTTITDIKLQQVLVESYEEKVNKNKRVITQTVFSIQVAVSTLAEKNIKITPSSIELIQVRDDKGTVYPVLSLSPEESDIKPGNKQLFSIRVDGSPSWWSRIKTMKLELAAGFIGNDNAIVLSQHVRDIDRKEVDGFR